MNTANLELELIMDRMIKEHRNRIKRKKYPFRFLVIVSAFNLTIEPINIFLGLIGLFF